jgi:hypothetical protein
MNCEHGTGEAICEFVRCSGVFDNQMFVREEVFWESRLVRQWAEASTCEKHTLSGVFSLTAVTINPVATLKAHSNNISVHVNDFCWAVFGSTYDAGARVL